jgi:hypothetical protein
MSTMMHDLEALYRETGNPIYVWKAFAEECRQGEPLPGWIEDYLRECAGHLIDMAEAERRFTPEPGQAACLAERGRAENAAGLGPDAHRLERFRRVSGQRAQRARCVASRDATEADQG